MLFRLFMLGYLKDIIVAEKVNKIIVHRYESPCGALILGSCGDRLCLCDWPSGRHHERVRHRLSRLLDAEFTAGTSAVIETTMIQLDEYFAGQRREFDVPLMFAGTEFQKQVWNELLLIPHGRTTTYGELARRIGHPAAVRAIATAVGSNALSILVPCHRVLGADGALTGYAGGLPAKRHLLALENSLPVEIEQLC